jgi:hypothetical protein
MTTTINASPTNGIVQTADGSGVMKLQSNGVTTNALAWVNFNGTNGSIRSQYNVSSVTRVAAGNYTITFTNAMADTNYSPQVNNQSFGNGYGSSNNVFSTGYMTNAAPSTGSFSICTYRTATGVLDESAYVLVAVFGN